MSLWGAGITAQSYLCVWRPRTCCWGDGRERGCWNGVRDGGESWNTLKCDGTTSILHLLPYLHWLLPDVSWNILISSPQTLFFYFLPVLRTMPTTQKELEKCELFTIKCTRFRMPPSDSPGYCFNLSLSPLNASVFSLLLKLTLNLCCHVPLR